MARMIDGDKLVENLRLIATCWSISPYVSKEKHNGAVDMLREVEREVKEAPTLTPPNEWVSVEERLPELPKEKYCWVCVLGCRKSSKECIPMFYERTVVRGKTVERWKDVWDRITYELPDYWMPLPEPPDRRQPEGEV